MTYNIYSGLDLKDQHTQEWRLKPETGLLRGAYVGLTFGATIILFVT